MHDCLHKMHMAEAPLRKTCLWRQRQSQSHLNPELDGGLVVADAARQQRLGVLRRLQPRRLQPDVLAVGAQVAALHDELPRLRHGPAHHATP